MSHILRPPSEKTFNIADALAGIPRCILMLESTLHDVISDPHDAQFRATARNLARSLSAGCKDCGFKESSDTLRTIESALAFPPGGNPALQRSFADRLQELLALLKAQAQQGKSGERE